MRRILVILAKMTLVALLAQFAAVFLVKLIVLAAGHF